MSTNPFFEHIAKNTLGIKTLNTRATDKRVEVSIASITQALEAAFAAGQLASTKKSDKQTLDGGGYLATIEVSYADLVAAFGEPSPSDQYKTEAEWTIRFPKGQKIAIYNYKNSKCYSPTMPDIETVTEWHISGNKVALVDNIIRMLAGNAKLICKAGE